MEKRISFVEGFGDFDQGDGFQAGSPLVAPGAEAMTVALLLRFDTFDLPGTLATDVKFIAGNQPLGAASGWGFVLSTTGVLARAGAAGILAGYNFTDGDKPVGGRVLGAHMTLEPLVQLPGFVRLRLYINGTLVDEITSGTPTVFGTGLMSIGADGLAGFQPLGSSADIPSARNGVAGLAYGEFTMSPADVAEHWRQTVEAEDVADGSFGWNNLWSVRQGLPDLELAGGDSAAWADEIAAAVLTRTQFNDQTPSMSVGVRRSQLY